MRSALLLLLPLACAAYAADPVDSVRLYALDCGHASAKDMGFLSDTGEYDGKSFGVAVPCFVIRHPKGTLLWDTGLGDKLVGPKGGVDRGPIHMEVKRTIAEELRAAGLTPADISYVAFSHFHFDHTGNANLFKDATWIINSTELAFANSTPTPVSVDPETISGYKSVKTKMIDGDLDVFEDGSVRILRMPGHTPGHQMLLLKLKKSGAVLLSGDLYHTRENRKSRLVPVFNVERADTLASMDRAERLIKNLKARLIVQHDERDFKALPKAPHYLD
jgi:glyoxylase-like metal-dependent hydrolase (beta-lactamase superfamily II)